MLVPGQGKGGQTPAALNDQSVRQMLLIRYVYFTENGVWKIILGRFYFLKWCFVDPWGAVDGLQVTSIQISADSRPLFWSSLTGNPNDLFYKTKCCFSHLE